MIPSFSLTSFSIGPLTVQVWGMLVALGFVVGAGAAGWMAKKRGLKANIVYDLAPWLVIAGMVGGRLGHVLLYDPGYYLARPLEIVALWEGGMSVFGGFLACIACGVWYLKKKQVDVHAYADVLVFGLPVGKIFGRIGCFLIHDHPGTLTDFALGVRYPDGEVRHDLGLYLAINALVMAAVFFWLAKRGARQGTYIVIFLIWYGIVRFSLDFLRVVDVRYAGLTPGQYLSLLFVLGGIGYGLWIKHGVKKQESR
jgi:phosphatidylglycerol:prolipoprotein diacylglycerol transferase